MPDSPTASESVATGPRLLDDYRGSVCGYDEFRDPSGHIRPQWQELTENLRAFVANGFGELSAAASRQLADNGVVYHSFQDAEDRVRPWDLDLLPYLFASEEWSRLSDGLRQRGRLLNRILADLYGPQTLLRDRLLPREIIHGNQAFLYPTHGLEVPSQNYLPIAAFEVARGLSGDWFVMADRTSAPKGLGFALENRVVQAGQMRELLLDHQVQSLLPFFRRFRTNLEQLTWRRTDDPGLVLLSAGPADMFSFEDAYLSRVLNVPLVEADDLAVRDRQVFLKTLSGLQPVDVILRRTSDAGADPLELRTPSPYGIAGLIECLRCRTVAVANPLGTRLTELPVFMVFLPELCRRLLGEDLILPSIATWWMNDPARKAEAFERMGELVFKPAFQKSGGLERFPDRMSESERKKLREDIEANPRAWVAQEQVQRSAVPTWTGSGFSPGYVAFRMFLTSDGTNGTVLPGALMRVARSEGPLELSTTAGDTSKDVWVPPQGPEYEPVTTAVSERPVPIKRIGADLPSRVADHLFWLGRELERADACTRLYRLLIRTVLAGSDSDADLQIDVIGDVLAEMRFLPEKFTPARLRGSARQIEENLYPLICDVGTGSPLSGAVREAERLASVVRDRLSPDAWRSITRLHRAIAPLSGSRRVTTNGLLQRLGLLLESLQACRGHFADGMTRGPGWVFHEVGRRYQRAEFCASLLGRGMTTNGDGSERIWQLLMEACESSMTYRSRYRARLRYEPVLDLLMTDETNPRSLLYQLEMLVDLAKRFPREQHPPGMSREDREIRSARHLVQMADIDEIGEQIRADNPKPFHSLLNDVRKHLAAFDDAVQRRYLLHAVDLHEYTTS